MQRGVAVVVVGYPAVPLQAERCRFCISAAHTEEQLEKALAVVVEVGDKLGIRFEKNKDSKLRAEKKNQGLEHAKWLREATLLTQDDLAKHPSQIVAKEWNPEPVAPAAPAAGGLSASALAAVMQVEQRSMRDFRLFDPVGYAKQQIDSVRNAVESTMDVYGFGACGPRGFYGTTIPHLDLEKAIASFLGTKAAILYSSNVVTISSVIPALTQPGDRVILDDEVHLGIKAGLRLCKADIKWIPHGDIDAMERALQEISSESAAKSSHQKKCDERQQRTFIVVEAISQRTGKLAPLPKIISLKQKYGAMLVLDETLSFGTLGVNGRGLTEHFACDTSSVDAIVGSLEHSVANVGAFCAGRESLVEHQRLGGAGYCFSAASPPCSASAAKAVIADLAADSGAQRLERLRANSRKLHDTLRNVLAASSSANYPLKLISDPDSYVQHLRWAGDGALSGENVNFKLFAIDKHCKEKGGVKAQICDPASCSAEAAFGTKMHAPEPGAATLRFCASCEQSDDDIAAVASALAEALSSRA
jgi:7-keto-8-aminopelargonate synthetase-like enzyme